MDKPFIDRAMELAMRPENKLDSVEGFAARAFGAIALIASRPNSGLDDDTLESLAIVLAKAPGTVVTDGTMGILMAQAEAAGHRLPGSL